MRRQTKILDADGRPFTIQENRVAQLHASYDIVKRRNESDNWKYAGPGTANAIDTPDMRQQIRDMSRFEYRNNPHLRGLVQKSAIEIVGACGPRLEIESDTPSPDDGVTSERLEGRLEEMWLEHADQIDFVNKLKTMIVEKIVGGEAFVCFHLNERNEIPIDFTVYEGEQFATPYWEYEQRGMNPDIGQVDGMEFDRRGNITTYLRLKHHPYGQSPFLMGFDEVDRLDSETVVHLFRKDRPSQFRGIPETSAMLEVYAQLRRFIESKVLQESLRAKLMGALKTNAPISECDVVGEEPIDMQIAGGTFMTLPMGWESQLFQFQTTGVGVAEFVRSTLAWVTQALLIPWNISAGDSSDYNFASGRLDFQIFARYVDSVRHELERTILKRYRELWLSFAKHANRYPSKLGNFTPRWFWDARQPIDETKHANANKINKELGLLDEAREWQDQGMSWKDGISDRLKREKYEMDKRKAMGLPPLQSHVEYEVLTKPPQETTATNSNGDDDGE
jgi:capsid protein